MEKSLERMVFLRDSLSLRQGRQAVLEQRYSKPHH